MLPLDDLTVVGANSHNPAAGVTNPVDPATKTNAYSWLKAPRYGNLPYEAGPLARMWVNGDYRAGISVMDRHQARAAETLKVAQAMLTWVGQLTTSGSVSGHGQCSRHRHAIGLTEAPRGALGHWLQIKGGKISRYQIVTPTCWNASPRDNASRLGPIEKALIGTPVQNVDQPVEVVRVIHSFDPCLSCAVHVMRPKAGARSLHLSTIMAGKRFIPTTMTIMSTAMTIATSMGTKRRQPRILIAGLGNYLLRDDGIGVHAVRTLQQTPLPGVIVAEVGTAVLDALHLLEWADKILAIDAMQAGGPPGTLYTFGVDAVEGPGMQTSLHELNFLAALDFLPRQD